MDLVTVNATRDNLMIFFQTSPGVFDPTPEVLGNVSVTNAPFAVAAADLDTDGFREIIAWVLLEPENGVWPELHILIYDASLGLISACAGGALGGALLLERA